MTTVCLLMLLLFGESRQPQLRQAYPELFTCGPNAIYMFLKFMGREVPYSDILEHVGADAQGMTLLDVKDGLRRYGLATEIVQCQPDELPLIPLPYIIYLRPLVTGELGHFGMVVSTDDKGLIVLDTVTGSEETFSLERVATNLSMGRYFRDGVLVVRLKERSLLPEISFLVASVILFVVSSRCTRTS